MNARRSKTSPNAARLSAPDLHRRTIRSKSDSQSSALSGRSFRKVQIDQDCAHFIVLGFPLLGGIRAVLVDVFDHIVGKLFFPFVGFYERAERAIPELNLRASHAFGTS